MKTLKTVLVVFLVVAQVAFTFCQESPFEETVHSAVSNEYLMPAEKLWVSIFATHQDQPTPSKVAYIELLNRDFVPVVQEITGLAEGYGNGYLTIPDYLPSDYYLLRVYTRNSPYFSTDKGIAHQLIGIINPEMPPVMSVNSTNPSFFDRSPADKGEVVPEAYRYAIQEESVTLQVTGQPADKITLSLSYCGSFPPIPTLSKKGIYTTSKDTKPYIPELFGHVIHGRSLERSIDTTETFFLSAHGAESKLMISKPKPTGDIFFETGGFSHFDYVIVQSDAGKDQLDFVIESPFFQQAPLESLILPHMNLSDVTVDHLQQRMIASQAATYYQRWESAPLPHNPRLFLPDKRYLLDDYNRFEDMATVIREYVPEVLVRREDKQTIFRSVNKPAAEVFRNDPLIVIDGLPVFDSESFSNFNPLGIREMVILNRELYLNHRFFEGAIVLTSFKNDFGKYDLPTNALFISYKGIQVPSVSAPLAEKDKHLGTLGPLLLWKTIHLDAESETITLPLPRLKGNYTLKVRNWNRLDSESGITEKIAIN